MEKPTSQGGPTGCKPLTTFVQTDTKSFREVVQRLTGSSLSEADNSSKTSPETASKVVGMKRATSKLHERRQYTRPKLQIIKPNVSPIDQTIIPPMVTTPSSIFSKLSIFEHENGDPAISLNRQEEEKEDDIEGDEEKAIKEKGFYLHPSPRSKAGFTQPELLTLFPLTSPRNT